MVDNLPRRCVQRPVIIRFHSDSNPIALHDADLPDSRNNRKPCGVWGKTEQSIDPNSPVKPPLIQFSPRVNLAFLTPSRQEE
jgi:hypothetical protein